MQATMGAGFDDGRGNVVLSIGYLNREADLSGARPGLDRRRAQLVLLDAAAFDCAVAGARQVNATGDLVAPYQGFDFNPQNLYQTPQTRWNVTALAKYEVNDYVEAYAPLHLHPTRPSAPQLASSRIFGDTLEVQLDNPFLHARRATTSPPTRPSRQRAPTGSAGQCVRVGVRWRAR